MNGSPHTRLVLRADYVGHNIRSIRERLHSDTRIMAVVKNNAYGHGLLEFASLCYEYDVRHFALYHPRAIEELLKHLPGDCEYLLLGYPAEEEIRRMLKHEIHMTVNSRSLFHTIQQIADEVGRPAKIHLEIETGMQRTGLSPEETEKLIQKSQSAPNIILSGFYTHLSGDPVPENLPRVYRQIKHFVEFKNSFHTARQFTFHISNSFGIALRADAAMELVRPGISLYGHWSSRQVKHKLAAKGSGDELKAVMRWESTLMDIRSIPADRFVGYGRNFKTSSQSRIGIIPVGYGDGYPKRLQNRGRVWIGDSPAPLVGSINMNLMQIDLSEIDGVARGDRVLLMSDADGPEELRADRLAEQSGRYLYELLSNISPFIRRVIE